MQALSVKDYESSRGPCRPPRQMQMNYFQRRTLLLYRYELSNQEINSAEKATNRIKNQQTITRTWLPTLLLEDLVTSAVRKTEPANENIQLRQ